MLIIFSMNFNEHVFLLNKTYQLPKKLTGRGLQNLANEHFVDYSINFRWI